MEYLPGSQAFVLEDGVSLGALFEIEPAGCEARTPAFMSELRDAIQTALCEAIPEHDEAPWVLQVYVQDEPSLARFSRQLDHYPRPAHPCLGILRAVPGGDGRAPAGHLEAGRAVHGCRGDRRSLAGPGAARACGAVPPPCAARPGAF